jgi:hypothetical protein
VIEKKRMISFKIDFSSFLCAAESLSPKGFKTVLDIDIQGTFNMCHAAFAEVVYSYLLIFLLFYFYSFVKVQILILLI